MEYYEAMGLYVEMRNGSLNTKNLSKKKLEEIIMALGKHIISEANGKYLRTCLTRQKGYSIAH